MGIVKNPVVFGGLWALEQTTYAAMHAGVGLSPGICEGMHSGVGAKKRVEMIPNGCDLKLFIPKKNVSSADNLTLPKIPQTGLRCIFTGAHGIANGLDAVLDAAKALKKKDRHDIHLLFIGDGKLKPHLQQRTVNEGLDNCLFFDPIPKIKLTEFLRKVDVGMMILDNIPAFYYGTSPNKFFDYISSGLPIVNNYPGWLAGLITENNCGIAVTPDNPNAFAEALVYLADNPLLRKRMGENSRILAENKFSRDLLADRLGSFLEDVVIKEDAAVCSTSYSERDSVI